MNETPDNENDRHGFVKAWNVPDAFNVIFEIRAQERSTKSVHFHPDEYQFVIAGFANQVKVFSSPRAEELAVINVSEDLEAISFHPEGNFLFLGGYGADMHM